MLRPFLYTVALTFGASLVQSLGPTHTTTIPCASIKAPSVPGAIVLSITGVERRNVSVPEFQPLLYHNVTGLDICDVQIVLTHPGWNDRVQVGVWLPLKSWNGRFVGAGGGGYATTVGDTLLGLAVESGYSAAGTDGGHSGSPSDPSSWALTADGKVNIGLLTDFASRSSHDMAVVGKAVTASFYGQPPRYSYWNGCSGGGRGGYMEAQKYPHDFDGILANAPAINWPSFIVAEQWPQVVMEQEKYFPTQCEFDAFVAAAILACDELDGVKDGVIGDPGNCKFNPDQLVGSKVKCDGKDITITSTTADIVRKILDGPTTTSGQKLWYGLNVGTVFNGVANTVTVNATTSGSPFLISDSWIRFFLEKNPNYNTSSITYSKFADLFAQSNWEYGSVVGTDNPDLSAFKHAGGKLLSWHGLIDLVIFPNGTVNYRQRVESRMGGASAVDEFYRLFLAPGVDHCGYGNGPMPTDPFAALVSWVEDGVAPDTLPASIVDSSGALVTRNICRYPLVSRYKGTGDVRSADSYTCAESFS